VARVVAYHFSPLAAGRRGNGADMSAAGNRSHDRLASKPRSQPKHGGNMRTSLKALSTLILGVALALSAQAQELTGTLKKIKDSGSITLGHRESSIPFSYYDDKQQVVGYSHELALKVVDAIKKQLNLPNLQVKLNPVTSQTRIPLVQNGTIDLECGSTTNNTERQKQVAFSNTIFQISTRLLTKKNSGINDFPDLAGKTVVTTAGTTSERLIRKMNEEKKLGMNVISAKDHGEAFLMTESGRAVAFMMDDALLAGERAKARNAGDWAIVGKPQSFEAYGCMMRKDDPQFKKAVDDALAAVMKSGEIEKIYSKWFMSPIPPKGLNLSFAISDELKALYKSPNDKAFE
jgi:glutamate/aspartate transport system substrate-binding protein